MDFHFHAQQFSIFSNPPQVMMIRNEYLGYEVGVELGAMEQNPLSQLDWTLDALERGSWTTFGV